MPAWMLAPRRLTNADRERTASSICAVLDGAPSAVFYPGVASASVRVIVSSLDVLHGDFRPACTAVLGVIVAVFDGIDVDELGVERSDIGHGVPPANAPAHTAIAMQNRTIATPAKTSRT